MKYLGHVIGLSADMNIMRQCRQLYAQGNDPLVRRFHMCSDNVKVTIFRSYCSSSSCTLRNCGGSRPYKVSSIKKLYVAYNNAFRMLFRLPRDCSASGICLLYIMLKL